MHAHAIVRRAVPLSSEKLGRWPLHIVRLTELGLDDAVIADLRPSFDGGEWDHYDVHRSQLEYLAAQGGLVASEASRIQGLAEPGSAVEQLRALVATLPDALNHHLNGLRPHRRRAMRRYRLERAAGGDWSIDLRDDRSFRQAVTGYRAQPRTFALIDSGISAHPGLLALLAAMAETVHRYRPDARALDVYAHQVTVVARPGQHGHPAPEGLHQDGADFIVSAVVIERDNVTGGVSRVFDGREGTLVVETELQRGEGIFQADAGSNLWHEITPIALEDASRNGHRMTLGFDFHIV